MTKRFAGLLVVSSVLLSACGEPDDGPDVVGSSSSSSDATTDAPGPEGGPSSTSVATTAPGPDATSATESSSDSGTDTTAGPMIPGCDDVVPGEFARCLDAQGMSDTTLCHWMGGGTSLLPPNCITAALVEGGSVCSIPDCEDRCDCFAPPATGTATVECLENVVADHKTCVLYCGDGELCPDGMACSYNICVWPPA